MIRLRFVLPAIAVAVAVVAGAAPRPNVPAAQAGTGFWTGAYFNNITLSGSPVITVDEAPTPSPSTSPSIDKYWTLSPQPGVTQDMWSVQLTRTDTYAAATYRVTVTTDDGMRVYVDNVLIIDKWFDQPPTTYWADYVMAAGSHTLKVQAYDKTGTATVRVTVQDVATLPPAWSGQYYNNMTLTGSPVLTRNDGDTINFDWGAGSPAPAIPVDRFSARWTRTMTFSDGVYQFVTMSDDGSRIYVDGQLVLNAWKDQDHVTTAANKQMTAGPHTVVVEYYENGGQAAIKVDIQYRPDLGGFVTDAVASGLTLPTAFAFAPDGRIFIALKDGPVRIVKNGVLLATPFYTVTPLNNYHDRGLLGIALDPNFAVNGYVYLSYTYDVNPANPSGPKTNQVIRVTANGDLAAGSSKLVLLGSDNGIAASPSCDITVNSVSTAGLWTTALPHRLAAGNSITLSAAVSGAVPAIPAATYTVISVPSSTTFRVSQVPSLTTGGGSTTFYKTDGDCIPSDEDSHSIGGLKFGPDGMLYLATGDASTFWTVDSKTLRAQSLDRLNGKILRFNPANGQGLADNPYWNGNANAVRSKVWAYGVRNDFRFNFRPGTKVLYTGDVGWDTWE
ncbi:MAG TPA: PQQ-dependent sugar dehydrogenase, partial [Dehalococcoidia bacterium]|nr:PQQ-dependent sugar dehydrogenase [Dehalococcoidia bacterium]